MSYEIDYVFILTFNAISVDTSNTQDTQSITFMQKIKTHISDHQTTYITIGIATV